MRAKHYAAQSGYVYEYGFDQRETIGLDEHFTFRILAPKGFAAVTVILPPDALLLARDLNATERYAIAKLSLFAAFDERPNPAAMAEPVIVTAAGVAQALASLDLA